MIKLLIFWKYILGAIVIVLIGAFLWGKWQYHEGVKSVKQQIKTETKYIRVESPKVTQQVVTKYVDRIKVVHEKGAEIIKKVPVYVTKKDDSRCTINTGFVQLWNAANKMQLSDSAGPANETASAVVLTDVAAQHAKEAGLYHETAEQLIALQDWVRKQQALYKGGK